MSQPAALVRRELGTSVSLVYIIVSMNTSWRRDDGVGDVTNPGPDATHVAVPDAARHVPSCRRRQYMYLLCGIVMLNRTGCAPGDNNGEQKTHQEA